MRTVVEAAYGTEGSCASNLQNLTSIGIPALGVAIPFQVQSFTMKIQLSSHA